MEVMLKPIQVKRMAKVPYATVIRWLTVGHPRAGILRSIDLAATGKRHSYRIRSEDWKAFLGKLQTVPKERQRAKPLPRPDTVKGKQKGTFDY